MLNVNPHWRIVTRSDYTPFAAGEHGRRLRVVIDDDAISESFPLDVLRSFAERPSVEIVGTNSSPDRRVLIKPTDDHGHIPIDYILPNGGGFHGAVPEGREWRKLAQETEKINAIPRDEAFRALVLAHFCSHYDVDALVTETPLLQLPKWKNLVKSSKAQSANGAAALLGLHLRAHRDFTVQCADASTFSKEEQYYRGAGIAAISSYPALFDAAQGFWRTTGDSRPLSLLRAVETRLGQALRARDYFHIRIRSFTPTETWDDASFFFEFLLLLLSGALDASARFCHRVFGLEGNERRVSWRSRTWRKALKKRVPELSALADEGGKAALIANTIGILRNFIHAEALSNEFHFSDHEDGKPLTMDFNLGAWALPSDDGDRLRTFVNRLGDEDKWGIEDGFRGVVLLLPAHFMERALRTAIAALGEVVQAAAPMLDSYREEHFDPKFFLPGYSYMKDLRVLTGLEPLIPQAEDFPGDSNVN